MIDMYYIAELFAEAQGMVNLNHEILLMDAAARKMESEREAKAAYNRRNGKRNSQLYRDRLRKDPEAWAAYLQKAKDRKRVARARKGAL